MNYIEKNQVFEIKKKMEYFTNGSIDFDKFGGVRRSFLNTNN